MRVQRRRHPVHLLLEHLHAPLMDLFPWGDSPEAFGALGATNHDIGDAVTRLGLWNARVGGEGEDQLMPAMVRRRGGSRRVTVDGGEHVHRAHPAATVWLHVKIKPHDAWTPAHTHALQSCTSLQLLELE